MLAEQSIDGLTSVHDDATAAALRLTGAPIEGPTHFSQFDPLAYAVWGTAWFERGCISSHFQNMVVDGEEVQATLTTVAPGDADIEADKTTAHRCSPARRRSPTPVARARWRHAAPPSNLRPHGGSSTSCLWG